MTDVPEIAHESVARGNEVFAEIRMIGAAWMAPRASTVEYSSPTLGGPVFGAHAVNR
jgi:uncharacterized protein (DUF736 family)